MLEPLLNRSALFAADWKTRPTPTHVWSTRRPNRTVHNGVRVTLKIRVPCSRAGVQTSSILGLSRFVPLKMKRRGVETPIIIAAGNKPPRKVDSALLKAVARARVWFDELASGRVRSLAEIARTKVLANAMSSVSRAWRS